MKKTLISLLALGGMAMGVELTPVADIDSLLKSEGVSVGSGVTNTSSLYTESNTVLHFEAGNSAVTNITSTALAETVSNKTGYLTICAWINPLATSENAIFSTGSQQNGLKVGLKGSSLQETMKWKADNNLNAGGQYAITTGEWQFVAYSISLSGASDSRFLQGENAAAFWSGKSFGDYDVPNPATFGIGTAWSNGAKDVFVGDIANLQVFYSTSVADASSLAAVMAAKPELKQVPEPTTGTLSLLALAGLMARRRRK